MSERRYALWTTYVVPFGRQMPPNMLEGLHHPLPSGQTCMNEGEEVRLWLPFFSFPLSFLSHRLGFGVIFFKNQIWFHVILYLSQFWSSFLKFLYFYFKAFWVLFFFSISSLGILFHLIFVSSLFLILLITICFVFVFLILDDYEFCFIIFSCLPFME